MPENSTHQGERQSRVLARAERIVEAARDLLADPNNIEIRRRYMQRVFNLDRAAEAWVELGDRSSQEAAGEPVPEDVAAYNVRFDAANEAGQEIYTEAFWHGWMWARDPNFEDEEGMREEYNRSLDGMVLGEGWEGCRDAFLKRLPLAAVDQPANRYALEALGESTGAQAVIRGGKIEISIDVAALPVIVSGSCAAADVMSGLWKVTDPATFAKEVCRSLNDENEIGTTPVHVMFDNAFMHAIEQGAEGIEEATEEEFEAETAVLLARAAPAGEKG
jgi:hypothetical protein